MPTARYGLSAVLGSDGKIYAIGGEYNNQTFTDGNSVKVEVYDPSANTWAAAPSLPDGRYMAAAVADKNGKIYETGGITVNPTQLLGSVVSFTPGGNSWASVSDPMTTARDGHAAATTSDGKIYVVGGQDSNDNETTTFEYYAPGTAGWHTLAPLPTPRKMTSAATLSDTIYVVGGNSWLSASVTYSTVVEAYDAAAHTWSRVASLPVGRFDHATVAASNGKLYVFGGESDGDNTNTTSVTYVYTPDP
jgi:N-acetylneuraminic acid mutarotase